MISKGTVLVLGATGGIGGEVARQLLDAGWDTLQLSENNGLTLDAYRFPSLEFFVGLAARAQIPKTYE